MLLNEVTQDADVGVLPDAETFAFLDKVGFMPTHHMVEVRQFWMRVLENQKLRAHTSDRKEGGLNEGEESTHGLGVPELFRTKRFLAG